VGRLTSQDGGPYYRVDTLARWTETNPGKEPRHLAIHVGKAVLSIIEELDHHDDPELLRRLKTKHAPDLVILAAMLAKVYDFDLNEAVKARSSEIAPR
jgi:urease accessory protein UreF